MRSLEGAERASYDVCDAVLTDKVRIVRVPILPRGSDGMTLGNIIFLKKDDRRAGDRTLIAHELTHVRQFREEGFFPFLWKYWTEYARLLVKHRNHRAAYLAISYEQEARAEADAWKARRRASTPATAAAHAST